MAAMADTFLSALQASPQSFLQPSLPLYTDSIAYLKHVLDPLAKDVSIEQQRRQQDARKKRKRGQALYEEEDVLRMKQIHTEGYGIQQVWEQAKRVIDAARVEAERDIAEQRSIYKAPLDGEELAKDLSSPDASESDSQDEDIGVEGVDYEMEGPDEDILEEEEEEGLDGAMIDADDIDIADDYDELAGGSENGELTEEYVADKFGLNDGFFSIDDFNRQSEFLEQRDARGEDEDAASDEEDVDWDTNPLANGSVANISNGVDASEQSEEDDGDDDGPTFGDPDASSEDEADAEDGLLDDIGGMSNTNDIMYADFFAPPAKKKSKNQKPKKTSRSGITGGENVEDLENDVKRTMAAVHRDLFEDESEDEEDDAPDAADPSDPRARRSTHERRKAAIAEEIRKLEAANVAKREWMLSGEARAADRPMNSLLEEDLDFERAGKPVPVITAEVSESIDELIKRRILAHDFQDIIRRRPDDLATGKNARRGRLDFELDDNKSKKGLAEEYEEEHLRRTDPNFVDANDEKLSKEHKEIETLWREVSGQLDSLSSWHFRPKQPVAQLDIRVDAPAITMEDARPNAGAAVASASQLAPQEVYKAGEASKGVREEVVGKSGLPAGREEMSREEKRRRRRREKERIRKAGGGADPQGRPKNKAARERKSVMNDLKRGGVKVIGNKGEVQDVEGRKVGNKVSGQGAAQFKL